MKEQVTGEMLLQRRCKVQYNNGGVIVAYRIENKIVIVWTTNYLYFCYTLFIYIKGGATQLFRQQYK